MAKKTYEEKWRIIKELNGGGQAWTYLVENITSTGGPYYVLKRLRNKKRLERFETEIRAVQNLNHPNIVRIVEHEILDDDPYFVMEYCEMGDLESVDLSAYSTLEKLGVFQTICSALSEAHHKGIVHRDIKPENILLRKRDEPVVSDFGICFVTEEGVERMTETVEQMGARYFMSPELADGRAEKIQPASDVYSLGKLIYWMFKGRVMNRENFADRDWDLRDEDNPDHSLHHVYELFEKSINAEPAERYVDAEEFQFEVGKTIKTIQHNGHSLARSLQHRCLFCGSGRYKVTDTPYQAARGEVMYDAARALGISPLEHGTQSPNHLALRILECEWCGNIQLFRMNGKHWKD